MEDYSKSQNVSTDNSEIGEQKDKNSTRPSSSVAMEAATQENSKRLKDTEFNKETFHTQCTD